MRFPNAEEIRHKLRVARFRRWLRPEGVTFFQNLYREHGRLNVVLPGEHAPHPVHFREGRSVRNWMRANTKVPKDDLDDAWEDFVLDALNLRKEAA